MADDAETSSTSMGRFSVEYEVIAFTRPPTTAHTTKDEGAKSASPAPFKGATGAVLHGALRR